MSKTSTIDQVPVSSSAETITVTELPSIEQKVPKLCVLPEVSSKTRSNKFHCFFGRLHVYTVTKCLIVYHVVLLTCLVLAFFQESVELLLPMFILFGATGWALVRAKAELLWPFTIYTGCSTLLFMLFSAYLFFFSVLKHQHPVEEILISSITGQSSHIPYFLPFALHGFNLLLCGFHCWQVIVLNKTRQFLKRVKIVRKEQLFREDSFSVQTTMSCE
ncbi:hypothetical protein M3Y97_00724500 [Aphelenchoides bicaudatus]|nr:hypothetical protein M3Y97_00724500 [Aphelenchoides bicaudatus]